MRQFYRNEFFLKSKLLDESNFNRVEAMSLALDKSFLKVALGYGFIARLDYKEKLFDKAIALYKFDFEDLTRIKDVQTKTDLEFLIDHNLYPIQISETEVDLVCADPSDLMSINKFQEYFPYQVSQTHIAEDLDIVKALHLCYVDDLLHEAVFQLYEKDNKSSALETFTSGQLMVMGVVGFIVFTLLFFYPVDVIIVLNLTLNLFLFLAIAFKFILTVVGAKSETVKKISDQEVDELSDEDLPIYTILLPVFKESEVIYKLAYNLQHLNYPLEKLDVKLLIESDDEVTFNAVKNLKLPCNFDTVIIPYAQPKTKPKACNYGLHFSKGKYLTIYDAEDIPDSDQLKMVNALFKKLPEHYVVVQCALNYFNKTENFLTRMFTLEYSYWFDYMLPGLDGLGVPIPLGGTSNHFKFEKLMELGGWDGFNVTEDADLGVRAYAKGYKVTVLDSTTFEEANNEFYNWIRQRSRWIKGYMQTYLVHMRNPRKLFKEVGLKGFLGFQFFIGGTFFTFLAYPILLSFLLFYFLFTSDMSAYLLGPEIATSVEKLFKLVFPDWVVIISIFNFIAGNLLMIYINMIAVFRRRSYNLILYALANPVYWLMHSISSYKGLYQLITKPFYWEKTNHGLTKSHKNPVE